MKYRKHVLRLAVALSVLSLGAGFAPPEETLPTTQFVPSDLMQGDHYRVGEQVTNDGCTNHYTVVSAYGTFDAYGDAMLRQRVDEVKALTKLEPLHKPEVFLGGMRESALKPWRTVKTLATHPVRTVKRLPAGTVRHVGNYFRMFKGGRGQLEESTAQEVLGVSKAKRGLAEYVGVDPYSSNPVLQHRLNQLSWAAYMGGGLVDGGMLFIPASTAYTAYQATSSAVSMSNTLTSQSPESLRAVNKKHLKQLGVEPHVIEEFLKHAWFSPRHETLFVDALYSMRGVRDPDALVELALATASEQDAFFHQRTAQMLAGYHQHVAPLASFADVAGLPAAYTPDGTLILALPADYLRWTDANAALADAVLQANGADHPQARVELWITGTASPEAAAALQSRAIALHPQAEQQLLPPPPPPAPAGTKVALTPKSVSAVK